MKIKFNRTGGFANIPVNLEIDVDNLAGNVANELNALLGKVDFNQKKPVDAPDVCNYELYVKDGDQEKTLSTNDMALTDEVSSLFDFLMKHFWG